MFVPRPGLDCCNFFPKSFPKKLRAKMGETPTRGALIPLYRPLKTPSYLTVLATQSHMPVYMGFAPAVGMGIVWSRTLMVSKGWPDRTADTPPAPPAMKFLANSDILCQLVFFKSPKIWQHSTMHWPLNTSKISSMYFVFFVRITFVRKFRLCISFFCYNNFCE